MTNEAGVRGLVQCIGTCYTLQYVWSKQTAKPWETLMTLVSNDSRWLPIRSEQLLGSSPEPSSHYTTVLHSWASLCDPQIHSWFWCVTDGKEWAFPASATHLPGWWLTDVLVICLFVKLLLQQAVTSSWWTKESLIVKNVYLHTESGPSIWSPLSAQECNNWGFREPTVAIFRPNLIGADIKSWYPVSEF